MNKELLMQFLSEAIDNGASFIIHMGQYNPSKEFAPVDQGEALRFAAMCQDAVGGEIKEGTHEGVCKSFDVRVGDISASFAHSPVQKVEV
jgi:hypothetical protein